jgi:predicted AAA+ superfamily ATPase
MTGGMPAVVERYRVSRSLFDIARLQQDLLVSFRDDFGKYEAHTPATRLHKVLDSTARQIGRKFVFAQVDRAERAAALREALDSLCRARVCHRVHSVHGNGLPFAAEVHEKEFKVLFLDCGLLLAAQGLAWQESWRAVDLMLVNEGALAEQLVGQMLRTLPPRYVDPVLYYWSRQAKTATAEVDYLLARGTDIVPVEVKAGKPGSLRSLHRFVSEKQARLAVRVCSEPPQLTEVATAVPGQAPRQFQLLSIPFYLVGELPRLLAACSP